MCARRARRRFQPNRLLEVSPDFLEDVIGGLRRAGVDLITLDEMHRRLTEQDFRRRFVCFTFDDGYRDNLRNALPDPEEIRGAVRDLCPDQLSRPARRIVVADARSGDRARQPLRAGRWTARIAATIAHSTEAKYELFEHIYWWLRSLDSEDDLRAASCAISARAIGVDSAAICDELCMTWAGDRRARRRSARDHRRAHGQSRRC